ncbi:transcriptional regulator [Gordonia sp. HY285]|uniref:BTAD domain-containing putative transcriptional regulator n=1 Tax=Gordonia liuliyuniae TaxID=2911517 RepID=UPI001F28C47D|nr:BTAD domain-containing putative transcriptional regulator [Gordonia liuliyuniae]MCF8611394.1 transcriptional regulator [Gordonia liuliyuniae]
MPSDTPNPRAVQVIGLLGPVTVDGRDVPGVRAKRLLVALAAADRPISSDRLIDDVWGEHAPKSPQAALHTQISRLRTLVSISGSDGRYRLEGATTDLVLAEQALAQGDPNGAVSFFRGEPVDEVRPDAERLRARIDDRRMHDALASGDYSTAEQIAAARAEADPIDEAAHVMWMRALAGGGRPSEALAVFARLRRALAEELGADPGVEATAFNAELLTGITNSGPRTPKLRTDSLIGRDDDLAALTRLVAEHRVVTVQGHGGVGKTSIASAVGDVFSAGGTSVYFVPLAAVRDAADLVGAVAAALGVGESDVRTSAVPRLVGDLFQRLGDALRGSDTLLILDNCEQVIDGAAALASELIATLPDLRVLVTSRSPLLIAAEQVYQLPVLQTEGAASAAVELFTVRARSVRPDIVLDPDAVAMLCAQLDGLPLAIELAAARIRVMGVDDIVAGLTQRFALLRSADRTAPDRHRTLEAVIEWSWDLLDDEARAVLRRTCLFPNGFSTVSAEHAAGMSGVALTDALTALVDQSLLQVHEGGGRTRYRMLEMVREFGEERLDDARETATVVAAMAEWARLVCDDLRQRYRQEPDRVLVSETAAEAENLVWVLRRALDTSDAETIVTVFPVIAAFWASRGLHAEAASWAVRVVEVLPIPAGDVGELHEAWELTAVVSAVHLMPIAARRTLGRAMCILRRLHRPEMTYTDPTEFVTAVLLARRMSAAYRIMLRALEPGRPDLVRWAALSIRFNVRENIGDLDGALRDSLEVSAAAGAPDSFAAAMTDMTTASLFGQQGQWARALELYQRTAVHFAELGADDDAQQVGVYIVATLLALGDVDGARARLDELTDGWKPDDPTPQGSAESVAGTMTVLAEYQRISGTGSDEAVAALLCRAADLLVGGQSTVHLDPGVLSTVTAAIAGLIRVGACDRAEQYVDGLAGALAPADIGWIDVPQTAGVVFTVGVLACIASPGDAVGARCMALALRLGARHDYPALHELLVDAQNLSGCDADEWQRVSSSAHRLARRRALDEALGYLALRM